MTNKEKIAHYKRTKKAIQEKIGFCQAAIQKIEQNSAELV